MASAPTPVPDIGKDPVPEPDTGDSNLDEGLRATVLTLESAEYQDGNSAFSPLNTRDWIFIAFVYVAIPVLFALVVGLP